MSLAASIAWQWARDGGDRVVLAIAGRESTVLATRDGRDPVSGETTNQAIEYMADLFAAGPDALGSSMAGRAEEGIGEPETVARSVSFLAADLVEALTLF